MLYELAEFSNQIGPLNVFKYVTFRTGGAIFTALLFVLLFGPGIIDLLRLKQGKGQPIRTDGPQSHLAKRGTPTMGGLMILSGVTVSTLLWANWSNPYVWIVLGVTLAFGAIGFYDDYLKVTKQTTSGFGGKARLLLELLVAAAATYVIMRLGKSGFGDAITFPFFKNLITPSLGFVFVIFGMLVIAGAGNAVNLTDGLDGLAIGPVMIAATAFGLIAYVTGHAKFALYLQIHHVVGTSELAVFCGALLGAGLGFLWFNAPPAMIFMGDTGSLALGGALGTIAVATKQEVVLAIIGGLFVLEALSVIIQVASFKLTGRRVFRMAPLHHHFEQKGWQESTIVVRFWIVSVVLALIGLTSLKVR
ncbi:MAG TPA: phospho-N-acetylmuramoyl-pentapeptide-transferase [Hyphomicrobiaceae bacterium]|nr:phospho-N-acetylmuramoyl-pentapeptide-transferase [Hyphomicrobiaceae bacterium]